MSVVGKLSRRGAPSTRRPRAGARADSPTSRTSRTSRTQRGAAAVEAVLVTSAFLIPIFLGILNYGQRFWDEQQVALYPPRLDQSIASGYCTTQQILDRVKAAAAASIYSLNKQTLDNAGITQADLISKYLVATVSSAGSVGADVTVSLQLPSNGIGNIVPLPGSNLLFRDVTQRLNYVSVSTNGTQCSS